MIFLEWHLGLGDAIICNGLVRELAKKNAIFVPAYKHNLDSVKYMFKDLKNVSVIEVDNEHNMFYKSAFHEANGGEVIALGYYSDQDFNEKKWAEEFYRHAGVPWECRWSSFKVELPNNVEPWEWPYTFAHNDPERNFCIKMENLPIGKTIFPRKTKTIFYWCKCIMEAEEVHVINSAFLCLADSLPLKAKRKALHQYARPDGVPPTLSEGWEILT